MKQSDFKKYFRIISIVILFSFSNSVKTIAQAKAERQFSFCYQTGDTIEVSELANCTELVPSNTSLKVKSYIVMIRLGDVFQEFDPNKGAYLVPGITDEIVKQKKKLF